jgi:hypothetical protein
MTDKIMFEWMMCDLMSLEGYKGIDPQNPGSADNGKDAIYFDNDNKIVFAFSIQKTWRRKFNSDFASALRHNSDMKTFVFGSNQRLSTQAKDAIKAQKEVLGIKVDFYDAGRIKVLLDNHYKKLRQIYLPVLCGLGFLLRFKPIKSYSSELKLLRIHARNRARFPESTKYRLLL